MERRERSDWVRTSLPKLAYVMLMVAGIVFIWTAKTNQWSTTYTLLVPVSLMAAYFLLSAVLAGFRLHDEQAGDNLYYMGFLFTLTSLGVSLYRFSTEASIDAIVRDFGLAVVTTICGIGLRILYNQVRRDPIDIERAARHELAEMTRRVRVELEAASREFANFRRVSNQMLEEGFEEIGRHAERSGQQIMKVMESLTQDAIVPIRSAGEKIIGILEDVGTKTESRLADAAERMAAATTSFEEANSHMAETVADFATKVDVVGTKMAAIKTPDEVVSVKLRPVLTTLEKLVAAQTERLERSDAIQQARTATLDQTLHAIVAVSALLERSVATMDRAAEITARSHHTTESLARSLQSEIAGLRSSLDALVQAVTRPYSPEGYVRPDSPAPEAGGHIDPQRDEQKRWWSFR